MTSKDFRLHAFGTDHGVTDEDRRHLLTLMGDKPAWSNGVKQQFLAAVLEAIALHRQRAAFPELAPAQVRDHLQAVATAGATLLSALDDVPAAVWAFVDMGEFHLKSMNRDGLLELTSGLAQKVRMHLERLAVVAAGVPVGKHVQPSSTASRNLCNAVAAAHMSILGAAPRAAWFVPFMEAVGQCSGLTIGRDVSSLAIEALKKQPV